MNRSYFHSLFAVLAVLTFASSAFSAPTSAGTVVCVGVDGHVALEAAVGGICTSDIGGLRAISSDSPHDTVIAMVMGYAQTEHCGPCTDTEILAASRGVATRPGSMYAPCHAPVLIASTESLTAPVQTLSYARFVCHSVIVSNYVRSVSLRI